MTPLEVFGMTGFLSLIIIRVLADYFRIRLYIKNHKVSATLFGKSVKVRGIHIHHFVWGIVSAFLSMLFLYYDLLLIGSFAAGLAAALIISEAKELVLQEWES